MTSRILLTAGYARALHVLAVARLLELAGHPPIGVMVVSPWSPRRFHQVVRNHGLRRVVAYLRSFVGLTAMRASPLRVLLRELEVREHSLHAWARRRDVAYCVCRGLNGGRAARFVRALSPGVVVYGGGGILRRPFFDAFDGPVLNAHSGPLPEVRGMNACEWSLLLGFAPMVTIHLIDRGIDTGPILARIPVPTAPGDTLDVLREKCIVAGIRPLAEFAVAPPSVLAASGTASAGPVARQCFTLAPAMRAALVRQLPAILAQRARRAPSVT